jgi:hypothetical protein
VVDRARAIFFGRARVMTGKQLRQFAEALYEVGPVNGISAVDFVRFLLRTGVVGLVRDSDLTADPSRLYCRVSYEYLMLDQVAFSSDRLYYVHPVMGDCFHMQHNSEFGSAYPMPEKGDLEKDLGLSD